MPARRKAFEEKPAAPFPQLLVWELRIEQHVSKIVKFCSELGDQERRSVLQRLSGRWGYPTPKRAASRKRRTRGTTEKQDLAEVESPTAKAATDIPTLVRTLLKEPTQLSLKNLRRIYDYSPSNCCSKLLSSCDKLLRGYANGVGGINVDIGRRRDERRC